jgi:hypothetical protein
MATTATATGIVNNALNNATNTLTNTLTNAYSNASDNLNAITSTSFTNLAKTQVLEGGIVVEVRGPKLPKGGYYYTAGSQTTPGLARGSLANSSLLNNNNDLSHVCDFKFDVSLGISLSGISNPLAQITGALKAGKNAGANAVRVAVTQLQQGFRELLLGALELLNLSDPTGQIALSVSVGKKLASQIQDLAKEASQIAYDIGVVQGLVSSLNQIVTWINSLPNQIKALLQQCLTNFKTSLDHTSNSIKSAANVKQTVQNAYNSSNSALTNNLKSNPNTNTLPFNVTNSIANYVNGTATAADATVINEHAQSVIELSPSASQTMAGAQQP